MSVLQHSRQELDRKRFLVESMGDNIKVAKTVDERSKEVGQLVQYAADSDRDLATEQMAHLVTAANGRASEAECRLAMAERDAAIAARAAEREAQKKAKEEAKEEAKRAYTKKMAELAEKRLNAAWNVDATRPRSTKFLPPALYTQPTGKVHETKKPGATGKPYAQGKDVLTAAEARQILNWFDNFSPLGRAVAPEKLIAAARKHKRNIPDPAIRKACDAIEAEFQEKKAKVEETVRSEMAMYAEFLAGKGGAAGEERTKKKHGLADYWMQKLYAEYGTKMIVCTFPELQGAPAGAPAGANVDELDD